MRLIYKLILTSVLLTVLSTVGLSQDIIIKKDGEKVKAKIIEITDTQIKYYEFRDINNLIFTIDRALIKEIKFESGTKYKEERPGNSEVYYAEDRINNLKINFFTIGEGDLLFTFERAIDAGSSWEATLKIYGLGDGAEFGSNDSGFGLNGAYKLKFGNLFKKSNEYRPKHILHGGYLRPVLGYSKSTTKFDFNNNNRFTESDSYVHFGLDLGKQWILRNTISIDLFLGFHYYGGSFTSSDPNADRFNVFNDIEDGDLQGSDNRAVAFGLRVGGLFTKMGIDQKKTR